MAKPYAIKFYKSKAWQAKRKVILARDKYMCRNCKRYGKRRDATTVHHVTPIDINYKLRLHSGNLISLCNDCHEKMHNRMTGELTKIGKMWKERCDREMNIPPTK